VKRLLIVLLGLIVLLVIVDRAGAFIAEREISVRVRSAYDLPTTPHVTVRGVPFLTQLVSGHYQEIDVSITSAKADGVQLHDINARFTGVRASLSLLLGQNSGTVTASHATGTAVIPYSQVERKLPPGIKIAPDGSNLRVSGPTPLGAVRGVARLAVSRSGVTVTPERLTVAGVSAGSLVNRFTFTIPVSGLPMHLAVTGVHVTQSGVLVDAAASNVEFARA
jgi:LmeA-like phospholipid-binding